MSNLKQPKSKRGRNEAEPNVEDIEDDILPIDGSEIKKCLLALSTKMDSLSIAMSDVDKRLDVKIDKMESSLREMINGVKDAMDMKYTTFTTEIDQKLKDTTALCNRNCVASSSDLSAKLFNHVDERYTLHDERIDRLERLSMANELVISGVPIENNDKPWGLIGDICHALNCNLNQRDFAAVYRLKSFSNANANQAVPIVVKLHDEWAVRELFSCYFKKGNLSLNDIGFNNNSRIFINESLTKSNREIFKLAAEAKKANLIVKYHTRNGLVHVQRDDNAKPIRIQHIGELQQLLPQTFERTNNSGARRRLNLRSKPGLSDVTNNRTDASYARANNNNSSNSVVMPSPVKSATTQTMVTPAADTMSTESS